MPREGKFNRLAGVNFFANMPRDPFADDPNDPASFLEEDEQVMPLTDDDRIAIIHDRALVQKAAQLGANNVLAKPFTIADLRATVMKVIERSIG